MQQRLRTFLLLVLMLVAAGGAYALRPTQKIADSAPPVDLEAMIPKSFGDWNEEPQRMTQIVDPQQQQTLDRIYNKTLSRTYVNGQGYRLMLSIAYGSDQRDGMQTHYPEVCYPAQGFQLVSKRDGSVNLPLGNIPVKRIEASLGSLRFEPVTYWTMVGDIPGRGGAAKKIAEMRYGLRGEIPDGLLFRVSSIDPDSAHAFRFQDTFIGDILASMPPSARKRFAGI